MKRADYIVGLLEVLPTLTDKQVEYLFHLVGALFGNQKEENEDD